MNIKILIATHKKYQMPNESCYLPIHVGKIDKKDMGYIGDDTGENISYKNPFYCELTGLYWGVKNLECNYIGLVHYRRHFSNTIIPSLFLKDKKKHILTEKKIMNMVEKYPIILPKKRRYFIETLYSHYAHTHYASHLDETRDIIAEYTPDFLDSFDKVMNRRSGHMFNMFIMRKDLAEEYCEWLFFILEKLENRIDISNYDQFQARLFGRVSELLLNVWIEKKQIQYKEIPFIYLENIDYCRKIKSFLLSKMIKQKYNGSF